MCVCIYVRPLPCFPLSTTAVLEQLMWFVVVCYFFCVYELFESLFFFIDIPILDCCFAHLSTTTIYSTPPHPTPSAGSEFFESGADVGGDRDKSEVKDSYINLLKLILRNHFLLSMFYYPGEGEGQGQGEEEREEGRGGGREERGKEDE